MLERGRYKTKQQRAVLAFFEAGKERCFTVEEVHAHLSDSGREVGLTTVYRAITRLCEEGVLRRYTPAEIGDAAYYQYNSCKDNHLHIRCSSCGDLAHMDCEEVEGFCRHIASHHGFQLDEGQTVLVGLCRRCAGAHNVQAQKKQEQREEYKE
ncbi:MAG: transcriptional repressor [Clostridiales bacterium]|nr:transcriptional repressor [Clostridiales bacterium]